jgi:hypothetical protein
VIAFRGKFLWKSAGQHFRGRFHCVRVSFKTSITYQEKVIHTVAM